MWVPSPPPGKSYHGGGKLLHTFRLGASALHFKHLLIAGGRLLDFDSAALLLLLVTSLFLLILLLRSSATQKNRHLKKKEIQTDAGDASKSARGKSQHQWCSFAGGELPHLVFRRFPSPSDSLSASEISDSSLSDPSFLKSESSESSLPTDGNARGSHTQKKKKKIGD